MTDPVVAPPSPLRLTTTEVCQLARLSRASVWRRIAAGRLPGPIDHGRQALFCARAVADALNRPTPTSPPANAGFAARFDRLMANRAKSRLTLKKVQNKDAPDSEESSEIRSNDAGLGPDRRKI
ncbi:MULTISPECIES: helix-turn-helix domain-containing protein [unclassified Brevundimonas]|uniref:helix-turn-helix domain-containing protein n=1 Tax=unclassified Brevundimonas TaxID=2622653 RepID=UPI0025C4E0E5|nr:MULTISPECIES: helix-turn-helix domain-containing protein [unclassified Brevundimonas]